MLREYRYYVISAIVTAFILFFVFDLRHLDLAVPLNYALGGDVISGLAFYKTIQDTGWLHVNPHLGAPGVMDLYDYPMLDTLEWLTVKTLLTLGCDFAVAHNLFFFVGFFLSGWTCLFVLRHFGISGPVALAGGLLFAHLPAHFWRGTWHNTLAFYPMIPLGVLLCLWICAERPIFAGTGTERGQRGSLGRAAAAIMICTIISALSIYYAWFFGFFLVVSGMIVWLRRPRLALPWDACLCILVLITGVISQAVPIAIHARKHETSPQTLKRGPGDSQLYGLTVAELMLPTVGHRVPQLRNRVESHSFIGYAADQAWDRAIRRIRGQFGVVEGVPSRFPLFLPSDPQIGPGNAATVSLLQRLYINEKYLNALGAIGATGFLFLCLALLASEASWLARLKPADDLAKLNIAAVLLGSGFALLFAFFVPQIRAYNRIAIYIAFFSTFAVALLAERLRPVEGASRRASALFLLALTLITAVGLLDEIPGVMTPDHRAQAAVFAAEADYVREVEALLKTGASVFELPYGDFPEGNLAL